MISSQLLEILGCPTCSSQSRLEVSEDHTSLKCSSCLTIYAIEGDIPLLYVNGIVPDIK